MKKDKYEYSLRFALLDGTDIGDRISKLEDFCKKAKIDDVMFFIDAEDVNHGHCTIEEVAPHIEAIKKAGEKIKNLGITLSLNPWASLLHGERGRKLKPGQNFNTMVGYDGYKSPVIACPLCENWRKHFIQLYKYYCTELKPDTIWIEDDFRMHNHGFDAGCFCDLHMEKYCQALGVKVTREQFVKGLIDNTEGYRKAYLSVNRDAMEDTMQYIIDGLKGVQDGFGLMTGGANAYFAEGRDQEAMFAIISKRRTALNRLSLAMYRQDSPIKYGWTFHTGMMLARKMCGDNQLCVGEIENFPMTLTCKSTRFTAFQMEMTLPLCLKGQTLDIFEFNGNGVTNGDAFAKQLVSRKDFFQDFLDSGCNYGNLRGVKCLVSKDTPLYKVNGNGKPSGITPKDTFLAGILSCMGISIEYTENFGFGDTIAVSGEVLRTLKKDEIERLFRDNTIILTGKSISVLRELGCANLIGLKDFTIIPERSGVACFEEGVDQSVMAMPNERSSCQYFSGDYINLQFEKNVNVHDYTEMRNFDNLTIGHGICSINGKVIILPYMESSKNAPLILDEYPLGLITPLRSRSIYSAILSAGNGSDVVRVALENVSAYYFKDNNILVFNNFSDDDYDYLSFACEQEYKYADVINRNGKFDKIPLKKVNGEYKIEVTLLGCSSTYLKLY